MCADRIGIDAWSPTSVPEVDQVDEVVVVVLVVAGFGLGVTSEGSADLPQAQSLAPLPGPSYPRLNGFRDWHAECAEVQQEGCHRPGIGVGRDHPRMPLLVANCWRAGPISWLVFLERMTVRRKARAHRFNSISSTVSEPASTILYKPSPEYPVFHANSEFSGVSGNPQSK